MTMMPISPVRLFGIAVAMAAALNCAAGFAQAPPPPQQQQQQRSPPPRQAAPGTPAPTKPSTPQPQAQELPKIFGLPRVGEGGATAEDVDLLQRAARKFLEDGRCSSIDYGDRSVSRPGWYIVSCDGRNIAFTRSDIDK